MPAPLPILKVGNSIIGNPKEVAEVLGEHFSKVSSPGNYSPEFQRIRNSTTVYPPINRNAEAYNISFSMDELTHAMQISSPTSPGEDGILYAMVSHLPENSKLFLLDTLNRMWQSSTSHGSWKTSLIVPVLKPGKDPYLPQSYRPIALTSCNSKLF